LGGFYQNGSITEANFLAILEILLVTGGKPVRVKARITGHVVTGSDLSLAAGDYEIYCDGPIQVSNEAWAQRLITHNASGKEGRFRDKIRARDKKCVISGLQVPEIHIQSDNWAPFQAAHIFPLEHESYWIQYDLGRWVTDLVSATKSSNIDSAQNGMLLTSDVHLKFDQYLISVNPDDGYKVVVFDFDLHGFDGRVLDPVCRNPADPHRVPDQLLRWHYRQSVLANMRGAGEPIFEYDYSPGTDMVGSILAGPYGKERFELEMAARLRGVS